MSQQTKLCLQARFTQTIANTFQQKSTVLTVHSIKHACLLITNSNGSCSINCTGSCLLAARLSEMTPCTPKPHRWQGCSYRKPDTYITVHSEHALLLKSPPPPIHLASTPSLPPKFGQSACCSTHFTAPIYAWQPETSGTSKVQEYQSVSSFDSLLIPCISVHKPT